MIRLHHIVCALVGSALYGCGLLPKPDDPVLVEGIPSVQVLADSLTKAEANAIKWYVQEGRVGHAFQDSIDWHKEFKAFAQDDINRLRFKDAYNVIDSVDGNVRVVRFDATQADQEVRRVVYEIERGKLVGYEIEKERSNLFSSSYQYFKLNGGEYTLQIRQSIDLFFNNDQFVHGSIVPPGDVWRAVLDLGGDPMPLNVILQEGQLLVKNGQEILSFPRTEDGDSNVYSSAYFNAYFKLKSVSSERMEGWWVNEKREVQKKTAVALSRDIAYRFRVDRLPSVDLSGEHLVLFGPEGANQDSAVFMMHQVGPSLSASILTSTGDYRWLDGVVRNDSVLLSTMDGTHAYLFKGVIEGDRVRGSFCAGTTWKEPFEVLLGQPYELDNAEGITTLKQDRFDFSFPDAYGNVLSLSDPRFTDKVTLVTIMGTWCSNCLDETLFLKKVRDRYAEEDLEIVALDFELVGDSAIARQNIERHIQALNIPYPVLLASLRTNKQRASEILPTLNGVFSYPTLIVLDKTHNVARIHTGFNGPATGKERYRAFEREYFELFDRLVGE